MELLGHVVFNFLRIILHSYKLSMSISWIAFLKKSLALSGKVEDSHANDPANPSEVYALEKFMHVYQDTSSRIFIMASCIVV